MTRYFTTVSVLAASVLVGFLLPRSTGARATTRPPAAAAEEPEDRILRVGSPPPASRRAEQLRKLADAARELRHEEAAPSVTEGATTGSIQGMITHEITGVPMLLVTVVATSPAMQGLASEFSEESGTYVLGNLPLGTYSLTFIYGDVSVKRDNVVVRAGKVTQANATIDTSVTGELITIVHEHNLVDERYVEGIQNRGRTYAEVFGAAPGEQGDVYGVSFSGVTTIENDYIIDGNCFDPVPDAPQPAE